MTNNDNTKWIKCFNDKFLEFINELINTFPNDKDFKLFKQSFNMLKIVDDTKPQLLFKLHTDNYRTNIMNKDEEFFLKHTFENELKIVEDLNNNDSNFSNELMLKLKHYWVELTLENKETVWTYLILLYKINDKICI